jgi:hypothetical protein
MESESAIPRAKPLGGAARFVGVRRLYHTKGKGWISRNQPSWQRIIEAETVTHGSHPKAGIGGGSGHDIVIRQKMKMADFYGL